MGIFGDKNVVKNTTKKSPKLIFFLKFLKVKKKLQSQMKIKISEIRAFSSKMKSWNFFTNS